MTLHELVQQLELMQVEQEDILHAVDTDNTIFMLKGAVSDAERNLAAAKKALDTEVAYHGIHAIEQDIEDVKQQIVEAWDGNEERIVAPKIGVLTFRTTYTTEIKDSGKLLATLLLHFKPDRVDELYVSGYSKTSVKKMMGVIPMPDGIVDLVPKTTVKLEMDDA